MPNTSPQLAALDEAFLQALHRDAEPLSDTALFWYEGIRFQRDAAAPTAATRGTAFLHYQRGAKKLKDVPGQDFAVELLPARVCTALIASAAANWDGPRTISFRYDRVGTAWTGGYAIETSAEYREQVLSRRVIDAEFAESLRDHWSSGVTQVRFVYGVASQEEPGPRVMVYRTGVRAPEFVPPSERVMQAWLRIKEHVERGRSRVYYAEVTQETEGAALAEGDTIHVRSGR